MRSVFTALLSLVVIAFSAPYLYSQTGKIAGYVTDKATGEALLGVNVIVNGTSRGATSNADGYYTILNVSPGIYELTASFVGYTSSKFTDVKVEIDHTTEIDFTLASKSLQTSEVVVIAEKPVVRKDISASTVNMNINEIKGLPVATVASVIQLQAGIQSGLTIRGGGSDQTAFMLNGLGMKDERTNNPFTAISLTSIEELQVQTGGFNAEYGNIRSGLVNAVTREGSKDKYSFSFIGRYRPAGNKSFYEGPSSPNFYYIRPYVDPAVCWTGTTNGAWDTYTQQQYPAFAGWNNYVLSAPAPYQGLTPEAAQRLFLWQHRKDFSITKPDHDVDMSLAGPLPSFDNDLDLRFLVSYREAQTMMLIPMNTEDYYENNFQAKITAYLPDGMKLSVEGLTALQAGTAQTRDGSSGIFTTPGEIAVLNFSKGSDGESRIYSTDYWCPATVRRNMIGGKFTDVLSQNVFYEVKLNYFGTQYHKDPGVRRDLSNVYAIIPGLYYTNVAPYGYEPRDATTGIGSSMRMGGGGMSYGRDTSFLSSTTLRFDYNNQFNKYNLFKAGLEFTYLYNDVRQGIADSALPSNNTVYKWQNKPLRGALYFQDKIEFEGMIANIGLRMDYLNPNTDWYLIPDPYDNTYSAAGAPTIDQYKTEAADMQFKFSPRLGIAFPITEASKLYFNYGHFLQVPTPDNLFLLRRDLYSGGRISQISDPSLPMQRTVAYELGYEQSFFNEYLVRVAGYYKDVTNETRLVTYYNKDKSVTYTTPRPDLYEDIRGFEVTLSRNRGEWVTGFVNFTYSVRTYGYFNYTTYYQNPSEERDFIRKFLDNDQRKPIPQPYSRANVEFFTPDKDFGPEVGGIGLLTDWRLNLLGSWSGGEYFTWTGGGSVPGYTYNFQWTDGMNLDLRLSKNFKVGPVNIELYADMYNVTNRQTMSRSYGWTENDFDNYMKSLHFSSDKVPSSFGYVNIPGSDKPGDYRDYSVTFTPMVGVVNVTSVTTPSTAAIYYESSTNKYLQYVNSAWKEVSASRLEEIRENKSYIDMPNLGFFSFLNPRNIYFGLKFSFLLEEF